MKKQEFIVEVTNVLKEKEVKASQEMVKQVLIAMEEVVDGVVEAQDEVALLGMKISTKEQAAKEGVINFGEKQGQTYTVPAKIVPTVKYLKAKKDALS